MKKKFKHSSSVKSKSENGWVNEYDKYGRTTYHEMPSGYWCLLYYKEPNENEKPPVTPYKVVHKYTDYYN